ncbi:hypothetical protein [Pseudobdellovibrio sp. HCB154]|uniref:hypothetical protein n=1 Tax=Pseudobdellovibrio sp. HCB154 TaxID=3386277 RepID=UPI003916CE91
MNPRYKVSQKWTAFPPEFSEQIRSVFVQNFEKQLGKTMSLSVDGRIYQKEITLRIGLHSKGELKHFNFEASVDLPPNPANDENKIFETISVAVDALASLVAEYFENDQDIELPYTWTESTFEGKKVWVQHSTENPDLEAEANKLLGLADDDGVLKNADDEKSEDVLDATEEEFDEFAENLSSEPQMFKKKKKDDLH